MIGNPDLELEDDNVLCDHTDAKAREGQHRKLRYILVVTSMGGRESDRGRTRCHIAKKEISSGSVTFEKLHEL